MMKYLTAGESHGKYITGILDGFPAGVSVPEDFIWEQLRRRRLAPGRGKRQQAETDDVLITGGMCDGITTGAPIGILLHNASQSKPSPSGIMRPCHADRGGMTKYDISDASLVRERASARETAARMALFAFPMFLCRELGIRIISQVYSLGGKTIDIADKSTAENEAERIIAAARQSGDTLGGRFRLLISGVPDGLGSYSQGFRRLFPLLAAELAAIPAIKSVQCGGDNLPDIYGSEMHDNPSITGGIDGGISCGGDIALSCSVKPVPGTAKPYTAQDFKTGKDVIVSSQTSDTTAVFAAAIIAEGAAAYSVIQAVLEKFGGDSLTEIRERMGKRCNVFSVSN